MAVSVIIPCKNEAADISGLMEDLAKQKAAFQTEIIKITGVSPVSLARNQGAEKAKGEVLIFIDCDIRLGNEFFLANLVGVLEKNEKIGAVCASILIPPGSSRFQRRYAKEVPHAQSPQVEAIMDVSVASSACCAIEKEKFLEAGGYNESIIRGEDSVLSFDLIKKGYRVVLAPQTWCYHPQPANIVELIRTNFRNGAGVCFVDIFHPELNIDVAPQGIEHSSAGRKGFSKRAGRFITNILGAVFKVKLLLLLSKISYALGYFYGVAKYGFFKWKR